MRGATAVPAPAEFAPFRTSVPFRTSAMPPFAQLSVTRQLQTLRDRQRTRAISRFLNDIRQQIFADVPKHCRPLLKGTNAEITSEEQDATATPTQT